MDITTFRKINYGLYVISSKMNKKINGQIANTVFQVTSKPPTVAISINKDNYTHKLINKSRVFTISILSEETPMQFIGRFGFKCGRDLNKFQDVKYKLGTTGAPILLEYTIGYLECEVIDSLDVGTHTIFVGKVLDAAIISDKNAMTYDYYHKVKKGKTPKSAPTYIKKVKGIEKQKEVGKMARYKCKVCGYIYDPENGDTDSGIKPGTPFEELPDDWVCPVCGVGKDQFEKED